MSSSIKIRDEATDTPRFKAYGKDHLDSIPQLKSVDPEQVLAMKAVAEVLPFRVSSYVIEELIDWTNIPDDPIFQLTFPQAGMLDREDFEKMLGLVKAGVGKEALEAEARRIQYSLNPHPAGQMQLNVPTLDDEKLPGMQHKYRETVLFFPTAGQTCFSYCTYCFRWAQFVGIDELKFASNEAEKLVAYLRKHPEVRSVLFTGGDPMIMRAQLLRKYIEPLLSKDLDSLTSIRIGTKALQFWPYRYATDPDADDILRLYEEVTRAGKNLAVMSHYSHPAELSTDIHRKALKRVQSTGATVRGQAPAIKHINDSADIWATMWNEEVKQGVIPYYMFVERDTGAKGYFEIPLAEVLTIFQDAYARVSGLARTVRGPSMSATPGKVLIDGIEEINGEKVFVLKMLQGRNPEWTKRIFFARYDPEATWLNQLKPAFGANEFFYDAELNAMKESGQTQPWLD